MRVIVAHPDCARQFGGQGLRWIYADARLAVYEPISEILGEDRRLISAKAFQQAAASLQPEFVEWTDAHIRHDDLADALLTPLHRNPFGNNLLLHLTWLTLIAAHGGQSGALLVLTESSALARTIEDLCRARNWTCGKTGRLRMAAAWWQSRLRAGAKLGYELAVALVRMACSRLMLGRDHLVRCREADLLIDAYFYEDSLSASGEFRDKHLPGLVDWYRSRGLKPAVYPFFIHIPLTRLPALYARMRASVTLFVPWERFVGPGQALRATLRCLAYGMQPHPAALAFGGVMVAQLVSSLRFQAATAGLYPLLLALAPQGLYANGIRPKNFLDWFENQPLDKACAIGFASWQPDCRLIALRHYALFPNFASLYTTDREVAARTCPQETWVSGRGFIAALQRHDRLSTYRVVPALRYAGLYAADRPSGRHGDLLVALTHSGEESMAILAMIFPVLERSAGLFDAVRIKPHPDFPVASIIERLVQRWPWAASAPWLHWETRPMAALLSDARAVVTAGSSAALEALCCGVPVIMVGRQAGLDMNPLIEGDRHLWTTVYDSGDVAQAITHWSPAHPLPLAERVAIGAAIRAEYFEPVSEARMAAFDPRRGRLSEGAAP